MGSTAEVEGSWVSPWVRLDSLLVLYSSDISNKTGTTQKHTTVFLVMSQNFFNSYYQVRDIL